MLVSTGAVPVAALLLAGVALAPLAPVPTAAAPAGRAPVVAPGGAAAEHVVAISVDGLNPRALSMLTPAEIPGFTRLARDGASTLNARTVVERTQTLPNHTSMVTSRRVLGVHGTGVVFNEDPGTTVHDSAGEYVPSVFDVVHDRGRRTGLFATKTKFAFLDRSWNAVNGAPDETGADDGRDKVDVFRVSTSTTATTRLLQQLRGETPPDFALLHLRDPDSAGHADGWLSEPYLQAVRDADVQVLRVLRAVARDPELRADTVVIVTSDHGGIGTSHSDTTLLADYRVAFFVWGTGVAAGADLYALNTDDRRNPQRRQPPYSADVPPIRNAEVGNLALALLGLPAIPTSRIGTDQGLDVG